MNFNRTPFGIGTFLWVIFLWAIFLWAMLLAGCAAPAAGGMQPLALSDSPPILLPVPVVDQLPTIAQIPDREERIVFQVMDELLAVDPRSGQADRWQVHPADAVSLPLPAGYFSFQHFVLWRDGAFYNLPAVHSARWVDLSPDGQRIAYSSQTAPFDIHLGTADGTVDGMADGAVDGTVNGTESWQWPHPGHHPLWSPDGQRLAFYGWDDAGNSIQIYTANRDGSGLTSLLAMDFPAGDILAPQLTWSPDGTLLAVVDNLSQRDRHRLYLLSAYGQAPTLLYEPDNRRLEALRWSPDGSKLAFLAVASTGDDSRLQVLDLTSRELLADYPDARAYAWSPDGTQLALGGCAYSAGVCPFDLFLGPATGGQPTRLTDLALLLGNGLDLPESGRFVWIGGGQ